MKKRYIWKLLLGIVVIVVAAIGGAYFLLERQTYDNVEIVEFYEHTSIENVSYKSFMDGVLKYSRNGISMLSETGEEIWNQSCQMSNPSLDIRGEVVAVFDKGGTSILVLGEEGLKGEIKTTRPIEKVNVSKQGIVAAILKDDTPILTCYDVEGNVLVKQSTSLDNTGMPMDLAISEDGNMLLVSYLLIQGNSIVSKVVYYDFSGEDIDKKEFQVQSKEYQGNVIPVTAFLNADTSLLAADDALIFYSGKKIPEESAVVEVDTICNITYNEKMVVLLVKDSATSNYKMQVFNLKGELVSETGLEREYSHMNIRQNQIVFYEGNICEIYTKDGICKYEGKVDTDILEMFPIFGLNTYMMINANGFYEIRLAQ